ncbi:MAG: stage II sporulation protein E, partial [Oscillospiraceae bacterium]|nr:stage II sporulation protein E [Oscillospiraceae bacterium]
MAREKALERKRTAATTTATATRGISSATASASLPSSSEKSGSHVARQLGLMAVWAAVGLLSTRAGVYGGLAPFGVGVAAAVQGAMSPVVYAATLLGYLLPGVTSPFRYVAAVCAVAGIRWALSGFRKAARDRRFAPIAAFVATAATGVALQMMNGLSGAVLVLLLSESLLAGGFAYFAAVSFGILSQDKIELPLAASDQASLLAVGAVLLMAVSRFTVGGLVPGHVLAVLIILTLARTGKEQSGSVAGIVIGLCMTIMSGGQLYLAAAYGFGGLAAGLFSRFGRFASAGAFVAANTVVAMAAGGDGAVVAGLYEVAAATILAVLTPSAVDRRINAFFAGAQEKPAVEGLRHAVVQRLTGAAASMREVASTVGAVSQRLEEGRGADSGCVYRGVSDKICRRCGLKMQCWERSFDNTMDSFNHLTPLLKAKGQIEVGDVNGHLARHCCHIEEVVACVNTDWREWLINESAWRRLTEIRSVITDQFVG